MNIFVTTNSLASFYTLYELTTLTEQFKKDDIDITFMTTNRPQDKAFIDYLTLNGYDCKVFAIRDILIDEVLKEVCENIEVLILFGDMTDYYFQKMYGLCNSYVFREGRKLHYSNLEKELNTKYQEMLYENKKVSKNNNIQSITLYDEIVTKGLEESQRVKIIIKDLD